MLRIFTRECKQGDERRFDLADVVSSLHLPQLSWTAEDIFINVSKDPGLNVDELERVSSAPDLPNPVLEDADFKRLVGATHQFIDGEFVGFDQSDVGDIDKAVIRLDMSDGSYWTIILDADRVQIQDGFLREFGPGEPISAMTTRAAGPQSERPL
jgi:hypothetical protein